MNKNLQDHPFSTRKFPSITLGGTLKAPIAPRSHPTATPAHPMRSCSISSIFSARAITRLMISFSSSVSSSPLRCLSGCPPRAAHLQGESRGQPGTTFPKKGKNRASPPYSPYSPPGWKLMFPFPIFAGCVLCIFHPNSQHHVLSSPWPRPAGCARGKATPVLESLHPQRSLSLDSMQSTETLIIINPWLRLLLQIKTHLAAIH